MSPAHGILFQNNSISSALKTCSSLNCFSSISFLSYGGSFSVATSFADAASQANMMLRRLPLLEYALRKMFLDAKCFLSYHWPTQILFFILLVLDPNIRGLMDLWYLAQTKDTGSAMHFKWTTLELFGPENCRPGCCSKQQRALVESIIL